MKFFENRIKRAAIILGLCMGIAVALFLTSGGIGPFTTGPYYKGKPLEEWIDAMDTYDPVLRAEAIESVRAIGIDAIPTLTDWMAHVDSKLNQQVLKWLQSGNVLHPVQRKFIEKSASAREYKSLLGFYALGSQAASAAPFLEKLVADEAANPAKRANAALAYMYVAPSRVEELDVSWNSSTNLNQVTASRILIDAIRNSEKTATNSNNNIQQTDDSKE